MKIAAFISDLQHKNKWKCAEHKKNRLDQMKCKLNFSEWFKSHIFILTHSLQRLPQNVQHFRIECHFHFWSFFMCVNTGPNTAVAIKRDLTIKLQYLCVCVLF